MTFVNNFKIKKRVKIKMAKISSSYVIPKSPNNDDLPLFSKQPIAGTAKVCDKKTGECWEVKDGKSGETPPVKKTKEKSK